MRFLPAAFMAAFITTASAADLPDPKLTQGAVYTHPIALSDLCKAGYSKSVRNVSNSEKKAVFKEYGIDPKQYPKGYWEIDHLVPLETSGSNDILNLWPQSYVTQPWNAHMKDVLENTLHRMVCSREITLEQAQTDIKTNWIAAYDKYVD